MTNEKMTKLQCPECKGTMFIRDGQCVIEIYSDGKNTADIIIEDYGYRYKCLHCCLDIEVEELLKVEAEQASSLYSQARGGSEYSPDWFDSEKSTRSSPVRRIEKEVDRKWNNKAFLKT